MMLPHTPVIATNTSVIPSAARNLPPLKRGRGKVGEGGVLNHDANDGLSPDLLLKEGGCVG